MNNKKAPIAGAINVSSNQSDYTQNTIATKSNLGVLLSRLKNVRQTGPNSWIASTPTREDRHPSFAIKLAPNGSILLHDFGGDDTADILAAVGLSFSDLFPPDTSRHYSPKQQRPFNAIDILFCVCREALVVAIAGGKLLRGEALNEADQTRLADAVNRLQTAAEVATI